MASVTQLGGSNEVRRLSESYHRRKSKSQQFGRQASVAVKGSRKRSHVHAAMSLSNYWKEVQGCNDWENLLDPLHPLLRQEIIRYGEFVKASYKAFDLEPNSKRYLNCKYGKRRMFGEVGMGNCGYQVTKYIYATPNINSYSSARWIGYVAVSTDEAVNTLGRRDILVTFRGTVTNQEWISNLMSSLTPAMLDPYNPRPHVQVESGFLSLYTSEETSSKFGLESCREQLLSELSRLMTKYYLHDRHMLSISLAGHSMGSALAILLAYDLADLGFNKNTPLTVFSFGGPRVGNSHFKHRCDQLGVKVLRIANVNDPITKLPGVFFNENFRVFFGGRYSCSCYAHVGVELMLDFFNMQNPSCVHDLDSYISLLRRPDIDQLLHRQRDGVHSFFFKAIHFLFSSQFFSSSACNYHHLLNSLSGDILCSWTNELLFGLVLFFL